MIKNQGKWWELDSNESNEFEGYLFRGPFNNEVVRVLGSNVVVKSNILRWDSL